MRTARKDRLAKASFILDAFVFMMGAFAFFMEMKYFLGTLQVIAGLLNLSMLFWKNQNISNRFTKVLLIANIVVALSVAYDFYSRGTDYIHYVWLLTAIVSLVALVIKIRNE